MLRSIFIESKFRRFWQAGFWFILLLLLYLTLTPNPLEPIKVRNIDKLFHLLAFSGFTFFFYIAFPRINRMQIFIISVVLGAAIEIVQYFIPNRGSSLADLAADAIGVIIGIVTAKMILRRAKEHDINDRLAGNK